jgi:hypothetical protein
MIRYTITKILSILQTFDNSSRHTSVVVMSKHNISLFWKVG